jgi:hypothetical protein
MESETKIAPRSSEQESKRPSDKLRVARPKVEALSDDEEVITVRAPIAQLIGEVCL